MSESIDLIKSSLKKELGSLDLNVHLSRFTGTEKYYRLTLVKDVLFTDGVKEAAEKYNIFWLMDIIATDAKQVMRREGASMVYMKLHRPDLSLSKAIFTVEDGNSHRYFSKVIEFTDFKHESFNIWMVYDGEHYVCLLPSEY